MKKPRLLLAALVSLILLSQAPLFSQTNVALGKTAVVSSTQAPWLSASLTDGDTGTRWGSNFDDPATADTQSVVINLGASVSVTKVVLNWETAYASQYRLMISADGTNYTDMKTVTTGVGGVETLVVSGTGQFVKLDLQKRGTIFGYSLYEMEVWDGGTPVPSGNLAAGKTPSASSTEVPFTANLAFDGSTDGASRWASDHTGATPDDQYLQVDLGASYKLGKIVLNWEAAYGKDYNLLSSENGTDWDLLKPVTDGTGGIDTQIVSGQGRYVRMQGIHRGTGYGYSLYEMEVYSDGGVVVDPTTTFTLTIDLPYIEYTKIGLSPADKNGIASFETRNTTNHQVLSYASGTAVTISELQGSHYNSVVKFKLGSTITAPLIVNMTQNQAVTVVIETLPDNPTGDNTMDPALDDYHRTLQTAPTAGAFRLNQPAFKAVVTGNHTPVLSWAAVNGATGYDVYMNTNQAIYDWKARGNLLDRYTKIGSTAAGVTSLTAPALDDRWTYKWYVVAKLSSSTSTSDISQFSVYNPVVQTMAGDGVTIINGCRDVNKNGIIEPFEDWHNSLDTRVSDLLNRLSPEDKAYQMFFNVQVFPRAGWHFGGGTITTEEMNTIQKTIAHDTQWGIPTISAGDTTIGYKTNYPINSGLAAARDPQMAWAVANMARQEHLASGYRGVLGPIAEVGTKAIYPRIQEGLGEDADMAEYIMRALVTGYQNGPELGTKSTFITAKHWPSQGAGGEDGIVYDAVSIKYHMKPWYAVVDANASAVMPGYAGSSYLDPNGNGAGDSAKILTYLRSNMNYDKLIITDWLPWGVWVKAAKAGADIMGGSDPGAVGFSMADFVNQVPIGRINNAVYRILETKFRMGLFEAPYADAAVANAVFHTADKAAIVEKAASETLTLLKNQNLLPFHLPTGSTLLVAGPRATDGSSHVVWTSFFHYDLGAQTMAQSLVTRGTEAGLNVVVDDSADPSLASNPAAAVIVVGEKSYTHGTDWPKMSYWLPDDQLNIIKKINDAHIPYVVVFILPRPYLIDYVNANANAIVMAYRPGDGGGPAVAKLLFGDYVPTGTLPWQLPANTAQIGGDTLATASEAWDLPFDFGATAAERADIRAKIDAGITLDPKAYGQPLYRFGAGIVNGFGLSDSSAPQNFSLTAPAANAAITNQKISFSWNASADGETGIKWYEFYLNGALIGTTKSTTYSGTQLNILKGSNQWYVNAVNWAGMKTSSGVSTFTYNDAAAPEAFQLLPAKATSASQAIVLRWQAANDLGAGMDHYEVWVDGVLKQTIAGSDRVSSTANLSLGRTLSASSQQTQELRAEFAADGDVVSRWSSLAYEDQYLTIDFGERLCIQQALLRWENAYASAYKILSSDDGQNWTEVSNQVGKIGGVETIPLAAYGQYLRLLGVTRGSPYGISLYEWENYGLPLQDVTLNGIAAGAHSWYIKAFDRFGNARTSATGSITLTN